MMSGSAEEQAMLEARKAMIAKRFGGNVNGASTGGGGTTRRKKKGAHKSVGGKYLIMPTFYLYVFVLLYS